MADRLVSRPLLQLLIVLAVAALVYLPFLGTRPLDFSEGHRAVPGWTMLESHDYWHVKMFGLTYIRKPPGMPWAIAASSAMLGETTFAARLPSAIAAIMMGGIAWWYGRKWAGGSGGLIAGLSQALMPLMWSPGRTAEIEMLNNLGTQMLALGIVDALIRRVSRKGAEGEKGDSEGPFGFLGGLCTSARDVLIPTAGLLIAGLAKGPASLPVLGGVLIGACVAKRSIRTLANRRLGIVLILGVGMLVLLGMKIALANSDPDAVREDVAGQFLWSTSRVVGVLTLIPLAFASAMPVSLALLPGCLWRKPDVGSPNHLWLTPVAPSLAWAWLCSVAILVLCGVSNARYAMPAAVLLPPLVPGAISTLQSKLIRADRRLRLMGSSLAMFLVMAMGAWLFVGLTGISPTRDQLAGAQAAHDLIPPGQPRTIWANDVIEARPDVAWLIRRNEAGFDVRWKKRELLGGELPPRLDYLLLRTDAGSAERARYDPLIQNGTLLKISTARVRNYEFTMYWVERDRPAP